MRLTNYKYYGSYHGSSLIETSYGEMTLSEIYELMFSNYEKFEDIKIASWVNDVFYDDQGEEYYGQIRPLMANIKTISKAETPKISFYSKNAVECEESVLMTYYIASGHKFIHLIGRGDLQPGVILNQSPTKGDWFRIATSNGRIVLNGEHMHDNGEVDSNSTLA